MGIKIEKPSFNFSLSNINTLFSRKDGLLASRVNQIALLAIAIMVGAYTLKIGLKKFTNYLADQQKFCGKTVAAIKQEFLTLPRMLQKRPRKASTLLLGCINPWLFLQEHQKKIPSILFGNWSSMTMLPQ